MSFQNEILQKLLVTAHAIQRNGLFVFLPKDALMLIDQCEAQSYRILGVDAFKLSDDSIQPFMEFSTDISSVGDLKTGYEKTREHLKNFLESDFKFEVVVDFAQADFLEEQQ